MMIIVLHCAEVTRVCCEKGMITEILVLVENGVLHKKSLHCDIFCILQKRKIFFMYYYPAVMMIYFEKEHGQWHSYFFQ